MAKKKFKEYEIATIEDLTSLVNDENIDMIVGNLYGLLLQWIKIKKEIPEAKFPSFKWIDDGKYEIRKQEVFIMNIDKEPPKQ